MADILPGAVCEGPRDATAAPGDVGKQGQGAAAQVERALVAFPLGRSTAQPVPGDAEAAALSGTAGDPEAAGAPGDSQARQGAPEVHGGPGGLGETVQDPLDRVLAELHGVRDAPGRLGEAVPAEAAAWSGAASRADAARAPCFSPPRQGAPDAPGRLGETVHDPLSCALSELDGVDCNWDAVLDVLQRFSLTKAAVESILRVSAQQLGFWEPEGELLAAAQQEVTGRLAMHRASSGAQESKTEDPPSLEEVAKESQRCGTAGLCGNEPPRPADGGRHEDLFLEEPKLCGIPGLCGNEPPRPADGGRHEGLFLEEPKRCGIPGLCSTTRHLESPRGGSTSQPVRTVRISEAAEAQEDQSRWASLVPSESAAAGAGEPSTPKSVGWWPASMRQISGGAGRRAGAPAVSVQRACAVDECEDAVDWTSVESFQREVSMQDSECGEPSRGCRARRSSFGQQVSPWCQSVGCPSVGSTPSVHLSRAATSLNFVGDDIPAMPERVLSKAKKLMADRMVVSNSAGSRLRQFKLLSFLLAVFQMVAFALYPILDARPKSWIIVGLGVPFARGLGYGTCFWTGILFLTMSRDLISLVASFSCVRRSQFAVQLINCQKELHIFSASQVMWCSCFHALAHHISTFSALDREDARTLNSILNCAQENGSTPHGLRRFNGHLLKAFQFPQCPLPDDLDVSYFTGVFSTPGITGYLLLAVIFALGWFSRAKTRRANFRRFYSLHHLLVPCWVILLILHGANDWVGLGVPLVFVVAGVPVLAYTWTRARRVYLTSRYVARVLRAEKSATGKLLRLDLALAPAYRTCKVGEYVYLNVAEASRTEWHPYSICTAIPLADGGQKITCCVMKVGKWTKTVHALFDRPSVPDEELPKVYVDGPFYAPSVSMPGRSTVVGIGAGVGVTPFLSLLGGAARGCGTERKSTHVFWLSAFATDFMLFKDLLSALDARSAADAGNPTTVHLHATPRFGAWDGKGVGGVFELAAQEVWAKWLKRLGTRLSQKPTFSTYEVPLYAVVSQDILEPRRPLAIAVGSPQWTTELLAVGQSDLGEDVFVYFCGNDFLKNIIQNACIACNEFRISQGQSQRYYFYFERFG